jgi:hypothetical protein
VVVAAVLAFASPAGAADTFVNDDRPDDSGNCLTLATACKTIGAGITKAASGNTVHVAEGTYSEGQLITNGRSLDASGAAASTIVTPASPLLALIVTTGAASSIEGFTIRCPDCTVDQVDLNAPGTIRGNIFDGDGVGSLGDLAVRFGSGAVTVDQNTFTDPDTTDTQLAINLNSADQPAITDNQVTGFFLGMDIDRAGAGSIIRSNTFSQTHNAGGVGAAIAASPAGSNPADDNIAPDIVGNTIHNPINVGAPNPLPRGLSLSGDATAGAPTFGATLKRNKIIGHNPAVTAGNTDGAVTLESDLLVGAPDGLSAFTGVDGNDFGDVTATNVTAVGGSRAIVLQHTHLTLDSSIVDASIMDAGSGGADTSTCTITNSRGLAGANPPTGNGCDGADFTTAADPMFVNAGAGNYHLQPGSPMIDFGNPSPPAPGALDFDGDPRALAGSSCGGAARRDMGADEFVRDCTPPETQIDSGPAEGSLTASRSASFGFSSEPGATFACSIDGGAFGACTSPRDVDGLSDGQHTFAVRASDATGNPDPSPATRTWRVDGTAPETQFDSGPGDGATTESRSVTYGFSSSEDGSSFECSLDGALFTACATPLTISGLGDGLHALEVRATDSAGNTDASPARRTLTVQSADANDKRAPETEIDKVKVKHHKVKVRFSADETLSKFACRLDKGKFKPCVSPKTYRGVDDGKHKVFVKATDPAGNTDRTAAKARFEVG